MSVIKHGSNHSGPQRPSVLKRYNKERTIEALFAGIDELEYSKLKNGSIRCLICRSQPVFNDPKGFVAHRYGKKHKEEKRRRSDLQPEKDQNKSISRTIKKGKKEEQKMALLQYTNQIKDQILNNTYQEEDQHSSKKATNDSTSTNNKSSPSSLSYYNYMNPSSFPTCLTTDPSKPPNDVIQFQIAPETTVQLSKPPASLSDYDLKMIQKGYIKDEHGGWRRDENVEFESDDEDYIPPS